MSTHSPAPWGIVGRYGKYSDEIADANGQAVAWAFTRKGDPQSVTGVLPHPQGEANARLIAAAPELLDALRMVLDDPDSLAGRPRTEECVREAIAKAEGRAA